MEDNRTFCLIVVQYDDGEGGGSWLCEEGQPIEYQGLSLAEQAARRLRHAFFSILEKGLLLVARVIV